MKHPYVQQEKNIFAASIEVLGAALEDTFGGHLTIGWAHSWLVAGRSFQVGNSISAIPLEQ